MKTLQELYHEVIKSDELKKEFLEAGKNGKAEEFIKAHGCDATLDEIKDFLEAQAKADKELSADELENVAGGGCNDVTFLEIRMSMFTLGVGCALTATYSAISGHVGQETDSEGRLCSEVHEENL
ncbi:MAG: hypothetical protein V3G42_09775 [Oscillospiraceae bacterium]